MRSLFILLVSFSMGHLTANGIIHRDILDLVCAGLLLVAMLLFIFKSESVKE